MEHNLDDHLNLDGEMGGDFIHSDDTVVNQEDIALDASGNDEGIPMEFEHIEEQQMLMDTGGEEIIVSDFIGDQFVLQDYCSQEDPMAEPMAVVETEAKSLPTIDLQFEPQSISIPASNVVMQEVQMNPTYISVKAAPAPAVRPIAPKKETVLTKGLPRQIPIAPKPAKLVQANIPRGNTKATFVPKQYAIAPKPAVSVSGTSPVALVINKKVQLVKKVPATETVVSSTKGNTVLAQIRKQLVMVPGRGSQRPKIKLVGPGVPTMRLVGSTDTEQAKLIKTQSIQSIAGQQTKPVMAKVIVQSQPSLAEDINQPAVITKLMPASSTAPSHTMKYVTMHQKTVPIAIASNKVLIGSPTKQGVRFAAKKQQIIAIKSPLTNNLSPAPALQQGSGITTKKVVIAANQSQNIVLQSASQTKPVQTIQLSKIANANQSGPKSQLHQINVPGKGVQYIRLVTNPTQTTTKPTTKLTHEAAPGKTFVLTNRKGNLLQMTTEKMVSGQSSPIVVTGNISSVNKVAPKQPHQKLVRIAPLASKTGQAAMQARSGQSLLARPFAAQPPAAGVASGSDVTEPPSEDPAPEDEEEREEEEEGSEEQQIEVEVDSKESLQALIANSLAEEVRSRVNVSDVEYERKQSSRGDYARESTPHVIVVPAYSKQGLSATEDNTLNESQQARGGAHATVELEVEAFNAHNSPRSPAGDSDDGAASPEFGVRPRKACNCTKSQCLKLYCDCFANGEFCNRCNCNNCHNNLENEELRQKAIRGCLDRNPNAFRPKIGKGKISGPMIIRRHNKGCNCKRSGCLKNYCECYEAKIACTGICKCVGCRNVEETLERTHRRTAPALSRTPHVALLHAPTRRAVKQPCSFMTTEVIEAVCQCLLAAAVAGEAGEPARADPVRGVLEEFARCLQDIVSASHLAAPLDLVDEAHA